MAPSNPPLEENPVPIRFELLTARHADKVALFDCGNDKISNWLRENAIQQIAAEKYATYIAIEEETGDETVVGYVALRATFISYPVAKGKTYQHIVPAIEISYLARDRKWKRRKLGIRLVLQALSVALEVQDKIGGFVGIQLTTTVKGRHLYTEGSIQFEPHPAANTDADFYMRIQDARAIIRGDEASN
jgi:hypothetical protein